MAMLSFQIIMDVLAFHGVAAKIEPGDVEIAIGNCSCYRSPEAGFGSHMR
jgi:hypothetical protein